MSGFLPSKSEFFALAEAAFDGMALWEASPWRVVWANPAFWGLFGTDPTVAPDPQPANSTALLELLDRFDITQSTARPSEHEIEIAAGQRIQVRLCRVADDGRSLVGMIVRVPGESKDSASFAQRDPVTYLRDRHCLMQRLAALLTGGRVADRQFAVLFLDLDNFKQVNDEFGHLVGDGVLREAAQRIEHCVREGDLVVRFGGDEFVALIRGVTGVNEVKPVVDRIRSALSKPILLLEGEVTLTLSAGVAVACAEHSTPEQLLAAADRAMYADKHRAN